MNVDEEFLSSVKIVKDFEKKKLEALDEQNLSTKLIKIQ